MATEEGNTDDLMMCLVIFGWLSNQPFFQRDDRYKRKTNVI